MRIKFRPVLKIKCSECGVVATDESFSNDDIREGRSLWEELKGIGWVEIEGDRYCDGCKGDAGWIEE